MNNHHDVRPLILAVGPSVTVAEELHATLAPYYRVLPVADREELFMILKGGERPDLILLDVTRNGADGVDLCECLGADPRTRGLPVILQSDRADTEEQARSFAAGAVDFITRPIDPALVRARIRTQVQLKQRTELLESLVATDPLTGLLNRRGFDRILETEWKRASRGYYPLSALVIDLDRFGAFNEVHGREAGDHCLRRVAHTLRGCLHRPQDGLARFSGEEFVALLPVCDESGAIRMADQIRSEVSALHLPNPGAGGSGELTVSIGVAVALPSQSGSVPGLVEEAQKALYQAKRQGRNTIAGTLAPVRNPPPPNGPAEGEERRATVLIVDDTPADLERMAEALQDEFEVLVALSGESALELLAHQLPDLVLMDVILPDLNGYALCLRIKSNPRWERIPIIFLTVLDRAEDQTRWLQAGAVDFLVKPAHPDMARLRVRNHVRQAWCYAREQSRSRELAEAMKELVELRALLPICAWCQKIRNDQGFWERLADYLQHHLGTRSTHGICPECRIKLMGELPAKPEPPPGPLHPSAA